MAIHKTVQQIKAYIFLQKWNDILLQNATDIITKCDSYFIAKCDDFITKCDTYYKCVCTISMTLDYLRKTLKYPGILFGRSQPFRCHNRGLSVKAGMGNRGTEWGEWWECGESGGNARNQGGNARNQGGNAGNQSGNERNKRENIRIGVELLNYNCGEG